MRTNNDVEGWHNRLNLKSSQPGHLPVSPSASQEARIQNSFPSTSVFCRKISRGVTSDVNTNASKDGWPTAGPSTTRARFRHRSCCGNVHASTCRGDIYHKTSGDIITAHTVSLFDYCIVLTCSNQPVHPHTLTEEGGRV